MSVITEAAVEIGIHDEAETLRAAAVWGPVGAEAVLAQYYPEEISLFYRSFNVMAARNEGLNYAQILQRYGVRVLMVRDLLAAALQPQPWTKNQLVTAMIERARNTQNKYGTQVPEAEDLIVELLEQDINRYGEGAALTLNRSLSIAPTHPLGNSLYARDQMNVLLAGRIVSAMAKPIRTHEVGLYETVYRMHLAPHVVINIPKGETFEGGDAYIHNGTVFVGVGARTTLGAAFSIYKTLKPQLDEHGLQFAVVEDENHLNKSFSEQQNSMHLDTFSNPIGLREIVVCVEEARLRRIRFLVSVNGNTVMQDGSMSFIDFLERKEDNIVRIPLKEQQAFGCNFLLLGKNPDGKWTILVPLRDNTDTNNQLVRLGKQLVYTDLLESTKGNGAAHCMTGQLLRSNT